MAEEATFEVMVSGPIRGGTDAWRRAQCAPASELPELSPGDKQHAKKFGTSEEEYARRQLAARYSVEWMQGRGAEFGRIVQKVLDSMTSGYRLLGVKLEGLKERWIVRVQTPLGTGTGKGVANIAIPENLVNDLLDSYTIQDLDQLKSLLATNLERKDLIGLQ